MGVLSAQLLTSGRAQFWKTSAKKSLIFLSYRSELPLSGGVRHPTLAEKPRGVSSHPVTQGCSPRARPLFYRAAAQSASDHHSPRPSSLSSCGRQLRSPPIARSVRGMSHERGDGQRPGQSSFPGRRQSGVVPRTLSRPRRRVSAPLREPQQRPLGLSARLRQRVGAGLVRQAEDQMRSLPSAPLPAGHGRGDLRASRGPGRRRPAAGHRRLPHAPGRKLLLPGGRFRQAGLPAGHRGVWRNLPAGRRADCCGAVALGQ